MRIGLDVQTLQTAEATRGIGRVVRSLVGLLANQLEHELVLFGREGDPGELAPLLGRRVTYAAIQGPDGEDVATTLTRGPVADFLRTTPEAAGLDLYHVSSPMMPDILLPQAMDHVAMVSTLYDAIPALWQERRTPLMGRAAMASLDERARTLAGYHQHLAISGCTARDCVILQHLPVRRMFVSYVPCAAPIPMDDAEARRLAESVGVTKASVLCISGYNPRKNLRGTLTAYARVPAELRAAHPLVLVCKLQTAERAELESLARELGLEDQFVATGYVPDEVLAALLQTASVLFFPSEYEGFGLPVAEALLAGVPVVTRRNSSLPEVTGPGGLLTEPGDGPAAEALTRLLTDSELRQQLASEGRRHASQFLPEPYIERVLRGYVRGLEVMRYGDESVERTGSISGSFGVVTWDGALESARETGGADEVNQARAMVRRSLGVSPHGTLVVVGGGVHPDNRTEVLAAVLEDLSKRHAGLVMAIVGTCDREEVQRLVAWASVRCLRHGLFVTGPLSDRDLDRWLDVADLVIAPGSGNSSSSVDQASLFLNRALERGRAPVVVRSPEPSGLPPEEICWRIPTGDREATVLAATAEMLLRQPVVADQMVAGIREWRAVRPEN